jgi:hypothetical protein
MRRCRRREQEKGVERGRQKRARRLVQEPPGAVGQDPCQQQVVLSFHFVSISRVLFYFFD